jgi:hypothetical protein
MQSAVIVGQLYQSQCWYGIIRRGSLCQHSSAVRAFLVGSSSFILTRPEISGGLFPLAARSPLVRWQSSSTSSNVPSTPTTQQLSIRDVVDRPMTAVDRIKIFPTAVMDLWREYQLYQTINEAAATTQRNVWRGRIPRRQREQQRHFVESIAVVGPLILVWLPPIMYVFFIFSLLPHFWFWHAKCCK